MLEFEYTLNSKQNLAGEWLQINHIRPVRVFYSAQFCYIETGRVCGIPPNAVGNDVYCTLVYTFKA